MMTILKPLDAPIPKIVFSFLAEFRVRVTSGAQELVSVGFSGARPLSPFGVGVLARGLYRHPPRPGVENPPTLL